MHGQGLGRQGQGLVGEGQVLQAPAQQLGLGGRGEAERRVLLGLEQVGGGRVVAGLGAAQGGRPLHVRVVHREMLLDDPVHGHRGFREVRQVASRHVAVHEKEKSYN